MSVVRQHRPAAELFLPCLSVRYSSDWLRYRTPKPNHHCLHTKWRKPTPPRRSRALLHTYSGKPRLPFNHWVTVCFFHAIPQSHYESLDLVSESQHTMYDLIRKRVEDDSLTLLNSACAPYVVQFTDFTLKTSFFKKKC